MRLINKTGLLAGALTTLLILASCSDSNTSTGVTAGRDAAQEILPDDASGVHDGDATVDDPTGLPETDTGGGRDGDGQGSDTNSDAGGPKDACWDHDYVGNNGKLGRWVVGSNTDSNQEYIRNLANMNFAFNAPTNHLPASTKQAIHCVGDSATALVWGDDPTGPPVTDAGGRDHPETQLYYWSLEKCENGKKHGDWGPIYTQACWDAGKSACYAYVAEAGEKWGVVGDVLVGKWVAGNHNVGGCPKQGWKGRCAAESCALTGKMGYYGDSCFDGWDRLSVSGAMCPDGMPR